jgi:hypothetical protein
MNDIRQFLDGIQIIVGLDLDVDASAVGDDEMTFHIIHRPEVFQRADAVDHAGSAAQANNDSLFYQSLDVLGAWIGA